MQRRIWWWWWGIGTVITLLAGCSGVSHLGKIGEIDFYAVDSNGFIGPSMAGFVVKRGDQAQVVAVVAQDGIASTIFESMFGAAGNAARAVLFGHSLNFDPDRTVIQNQSTGGTGGNATGGTAGGGAGGNATIDKSKGGADD